MRCDVREEILANVRHEETKRLSKATKRNLSRITERLANHHKFCQVGQILYPWRRLQYALKAEGTGKSLKTFHEC